MIELPESCDCSECILREIFFESVAEDDIERICTQKRQIEYKKGEIIIEESSEIKDFVYLKSGLVKSYLRGSNKKEQIITIAKPFDFVSLLSVFSNSRYNYSVMVLEDSVTCNMDFSEITALINNNGNFALSLLRKMSRVSDKIILESLELRQKNLSGRVAYILIYFADKIYNTDTFDLPFSRKEIGEFIGMTTENVIRSLSEFRKDGILRIYGKTIEIINKDKLIRISEFG